MAQTGATFPQKDPFHDKNGIQYTTGIDTIVAKYNSCAMEAKNLAQTGTTFPQKDPFHEKNGIQVTIGRDTT